METNVKLRDSETILNDIRELNGRDFYIEIDLTSTPSVLQMLSMVKRWRTVAKRVGKSVKIIAYGNDIEIDKAFQRLILDDPISFSMIQKGDVMIE